MAEPRYCRTLIVSTRVRSEPHFESYRPFRRETLTTLFARAAEKAAATRRGRVFDRHSVYPYFFFGNNVLDEQRKEDLRGLSSSIVDCDIYRSGEIDARELATRAIFEFTYVTGGNRKTMVFICGDGCAKTLDYNHFPAANDAELYAFLFMDLSSNAFAAIGKTLVDGS